MKRFYRLLTGLFFICLSIVLIAGCSPASENGTIDSEAESEITESQNDNDEPDDACDEIKRELASVQSDYNELNSDYDELNSDYEALDAEYRALVTEFGNLNKEYKELIAEYNELDVKYNTVIQTTVDIEEEDIEQTIFTLINDDRRANRLRELEWSGNLYDWAKDHSNYLANNKIIRLSEYSFWQAVTSAAGYATADQMATGMLRIWKETSSYEKDFLNEHANYGAVSVIRTGNVYYIVYFASAIE